ncbi:unnamed protein product [Arctia plantaginis]|uniref:PKD/REJ-like domain-containing protein n=1 Tax=Arctia plantaginis TaxID=874455 RepID=A0A8S1AVR4_ARCPL|nr:unnamed protein product [Arctia plantaginis]
MHFEPFVVTFVTGFLLQRATGDVPTFRILAPPFVCPKDKNAIIDHPDNTVITLQTDAVSNMKFTWTVRWEPLVAPIQRFVLALWRTVHKLEKKLNSLQAEPGVYVIDNSELLSGVNYIFNVTASFPDSDEVMDKSFNIDNIQGNQKFLIEGRSNMFSVVLVGGQMTYTDLDYMLEAQITTCFKTQDYYFMWSVTSEDSSVDISDVKGSRLEINAYSLTPGLAYNILCKVFKHSNGEFITETTLPFRVLHREVNVNFNIDVLVISIGKAFTIQTDLKNIDYLQNELEVDLIPKVINEGNIVNLNANISNVTPGCSVIWCFMHDESIVPTNTYESNICTENEHGIPISDPINFYSFEENFLSELTDYSNETRWKSVEANLQAATGTSRVVVKCECNEIDNCTTKGTVYADVKLIVNEKPDAGHVLIAPETGTAMETMFRISTLAVVNLNRPLRYTFYCDLAINESLTLGTYQEHLAIETLLPYKDGGTSIWVEVCDSLRACAFGPPRLIHLAPGDARTLDALIEDLQALVLRCEIGLLKRLVSSAIITYINADQTDANVKFTTALLKNLQDVDQNCTERHNDRYISLLYWLANVGIDTTGLE